MKDRQHNGQKKRDGQTTMYKTLHRKLKIEQHNFKRHQNSFKIYQKKSHKNWFGQRTAKNIYWVKVRVTLNNSKFQKNFV